MSKRITITLEVEDADYQQFLADYNEGSQDFYSWVVGELCQNYGLGSLADLRIES